MQSKLLLKIHINQLKYIKLEKKYMLTEKYLLFSSLCDSVCDFYSPPRNPYHCLFEHEIQQSLYQI